MNLQYAVALIKGTSETILGIFKTKEEADLFGRSNPIPKEAGLAYCFAAPFSGNNVIGDSIKVYDYYNFTV